MVNCFAIVCPCLPHLSTVGRGKFGDISSLRSRYYASRYLPAAMLIAVVRV
jgi:hypothetical protein